MLPQGPRRVDTAANSLTSPPPVAPIRNEGSMSSRPMTPPRSAARKLTRPKPDAPSITPNAANGSVSVLGTRRIQMSMVLAADVPMAIVSGTSVSAVMAFTCSSMRKGRTMRSVPHRFASARERAGRLVVRFVELARDVGENVVHASAGQLHCAVRDERDQAHQQSVFEQVLAGVVLGE